MAKPREVSVSIYDTHRGEIHVWNVSFKLKGAAVDDKALKNLQRSIQRLVESMEFPELNNPEDAAQ